MREKRYIILKNDEPIGEVDTAREMIKLINCSRNYYYHKKLLDKDRFTFKGDAYKVIDKVTKK